MIRSTRSNAAREELRRRFQVPPVNRGVPSTHIPAQRAEPRHAGSTSIPVPDSGSRHGKRPEKRHHEEEDLREELASLAGSRAQRSQLPRKRTRNTQKIVLDTEEKFVFKAIVNYHADGSIKEYFDSKLDLQHCIQNLWVYINKTVELWESRKGGYWQYEFEKKLHHKPVLQQCVTSKLTHKRTRWRLGDDGRFACEVCVAENRPCFKWNAEEKAFELLPLHDSDREYALEGLEIRYWMNVE